MEGGPLRGNTERGESLPTPPHPMAAFSLSSSIPETWALRLQHPQPSKKAPGSPAYTEEWAQLESQQSWPTCGLCFTQSVIAESPAL